MKTHFFKRDTISNKGNKEEILGDGTYGSIDTVGIVRILAWTNSASSTLKHLGPRAIKYITGLFNLSVTTCQIPKPGQDTPIGTSYRPISLLFPFEKVLESLTLPTINKYFQPAPDQHGFRSDHSTITANKTVKDQKNNSVR